MLLSRRVLLSSAAATATSAAVLDFVPRALAQAPAPARTGEAAKLRSLLDAFFRENLQQNPESATLLGLDKGENAGLKSKLRDESLAGVAASKALNASQYARLKA